MDRSLLKAASGRLAAPLGIVIAVTVPYTPAQGYQNNPGDLDASFGTGGRVITPFTGPANDFARKITTCVQPDGRLLVAGGSASLVNSSNTDFALVRFNADGSLDTTFGSTGGGVVTDFGAYDYATCVVAMADGRILVAGNSYQLATSESQIVLARYNADGSLDTSFGNGGRLTTAFSAIGDDSAVAVQPDGRIVVAGSLNPPGPSFVRMALARYEPDGAVDGSFGDGGVASVAAGQYSYASDVVIAPDGQIVVVGSSYDYDASRYSFTAARFGPNGILDSGFGEGGMTEIVVGADDSANSVALQPDGRIVIGGYSRDEQGCSRFAVARCSADGSLDHSFGSGGQAIADFGPCSWATRAFDIAVQGDAKIVAVGHGPDDKSFALARWNADGTLDSTFGVGGLRTTTIVGFGVGAGWGANGVALGDDGRILVAGTWGFGSTYQDFTVIRYNSDGTPDGAFGHGGLAVATLYGLLNSQAIDIAAPCGIDGRIVAVGTNSIGLAIARYNPDGSLDSGFDNDGLVTDALDNGATAQAVAVQGDGRIVVAGLAYCSGPHYETMIALARYTTDGSRDLSFNGVGAVKLRIGGQFALRASNRMSVSHGASRSGRTRVSGSRDGCRRVDHT